MFIDGIEFNEYDVKSIKMDLETCSCEIEVIYHKDKRKVVRKKLYHIQTDCNVDVNKLINELEQIINVKGFLS